jgi:hypothetical protein
MVGIMPKKDARRISADMAIGQARGNRYPRNLPNVPAREPLPQHVACTDVELPAWLPSPVASYVRKIVCQTDTDKLLLGRLTFDPRMRRVWTELLKRKRVNYKSSDTFRYAATARMDWDPILRGRLRQAQDIRRISGPYNERQAKKIETRVKFHWAADTVLSESSGLSIQERALVAFLCQAFEFARAVSRPVSRAIAQRERARYREMASQIRTDVAGLDSHSDRERLIEAAFAYEELADKAAPPPGHPLHVQRQTRGDERQTGFVLKLVDALRAIFGQTLYGTAAIVANVAFDCDGWTGERVRKVTKRIRP